MGWWYSLEHVVEMIIIRQVEILKDDFICCCTNSS